MGKFTNDTNVSFGPSAKLSHLLGPGHLTLKEGIAMSTNSPILTIPKDDEKQITAFLGRLAYTAQAQQFISEDAVNLKLNQAILFSSYAHEEGNEAVEETVPAFSFQTNSLATRIGHSPLYRKH